MLWKRTDKIFAGINQNHLPLLTILHEAQPARPTRASNAASMIKAPGSLKAGLTTYPIPQMILPTINATPNPAVTKGLYNPATSNRIRQVAMLSTKLMWALWAQLNRYQSLQASFSEYLPSPISGYPPFGTLDLTSLLCCFEKFFSMKSCEKTVFLSLPGKMKPKSTTWKPRMAETASTRPYQGEIRSTTWLTILNNNQVIRIHLDIQGGMGFGQMGDINICGGQVIGRSKRIGDQMSVSNN